MPTDPYDLRKEPYGIPQRRRVSLHAVHPRQKMTKPIPMADQSPDVQALLRQFILASAAFEEYQSELAVICNPHPSPPDGLEAIEHYAAAWVRLVRVGHEVGVFTDEEYVAIMLLELEQIVYQTRIDRGYYSAELTPIRDKISHLRSSHSRNKHDLLVAAEDEFEQMLDRLVVQVFREYGETELADRYATNPEALAQAYTEGWKQLKAKMPPEQVLLTLVDTYLQESSACAQAGAYYAACAMLGAALEARFLAWCYHHESRVDQAVAQLPGKSRPKEKDKHRWTLNQLVTVMHAAGALPTFEVDGVSVDAARLLDIIRELRNFLHPGKHVRGTPHIHLGRAHVTEAQMIYHLVDAQLTRVIEHLDVPLINNSEPNR